MKILVWKLLGERGCMMLQSIYNSIQKRLSQVSFSLLWPGFQPVKFALYNASHCFFDGQYISKTDEFIANTTILFQGEQIAIWKIMDDETSIDVDVLTSKIVHEMFHAFQQLSNEHRYPNELEAVQRYAINHRNLSSKLIEAKLLKTCLQDQSESALDSFLRMRKQRFVEFSYEVTYEAQIEQIEGSAQYVELLTLGQLNAQKGQLAWERVVESIQDPQRYFPIRVVSYAIGAVVLRVLNQQGILKPILNASLPFSLAMIEGIEPNTTPIPRDTTIDEYISTYRAVTNRIIQNALVKNEVVVEGDYPLLGLNVYDARCEEHFVTSTYFVMVEVDGQPKVFNGDFIIELNEHGRVAKVYRQASDEGKEQ
jgi:hypothetical protein